jgi:hypothetical protein
MLETPQLECCGDFSRKRAKPLLQAGAKETAALRRARRPIPDEPLSGCGRKAGALGTFIV